MLIYNYDGTTKVFIGADVARMSPREPDVPLVPQFATLIAPPEFDPETDFAVFDAETEGWDVKPIPLPTPPDPAKVLAQAKATAKAKMASAREGQIASGVAYGGKNYQSDPLSVRNILGVQARINAGFPLPAGFSWRTTDNVDIPFAAADVNNLADVVVQAGWAAYEHYRDRVAQIEASATVDEADAVEW